TKPKPHILAWIALGAAALGFILACIPMTAIIALVLLPIALILSIVALFMKGAKWPAITGLILAVVGGIIGAIVLVVTLVSAGVQALDEISDTSVSSSPQDDTDDADAEEGADADGVGSQENPAPLGSTISGDEYDVVVNSVNLDATEEIVAANPFNEAPADGYAYALVNATVTYTGDETGYAIMAQFAYLTSGGEVIESTEAVVVPPEPALGLAELTPDTSATGNLVLQVPVDDDGLIRVTPGILADAVFVAVQ
ncbi:MAG TPA: hypothetical protein VN035_08265, partial [Microbacterium sp.]|nr:hypothetical protein [Microbacterium sp.]